MTWLGRRRLPTPLLSIRNLAVSFAADEGAFVAVDDVSFDIAHNKTVALVGESGSGKTVISSAILGILPKNGSIPGGQILFDDPNKVGEDPLDLASIPQDSRKRRDIRGGRISIIFQEPMSSLSPLHTIGDQISEAYRLHVNAAYGESRKETISMLRKVGFPNPTQAFSSYPFELSGGLRQRAMIAMALVCRPALLIADEPTTALDVTIQAQILKLIQDLQAELNMSILFITHDLGVVANIADEVVVMYRGKLMEKGSCGDLISQPEHAYLGALLHAVPTLGMDPNERLTGLREPKRKPRKTVVIPQMGVSNSRSSQPILEVHGLEKTFTLRRSGLFSEETREIKAVDDVSFSVMPGETLGIVGESGSGKSTVSKMIMRAVHPDKGRIVYRDGGTETDILALSESQLWAFRCQLQYIFQDPFGSLNPRMTVMDIISEPLVIHNVGNEAQRLEKVKELLVAVGLDTRHLRRYPHSFSGGQRQRIGIARALALEPRLLICDEPVSALDVSVQAQILNLLKDLQQELGLTYIFIAHNLAVVRYIAQQVAVMCQGRIVELAPTEQLFAEPKHPYTRALLAAVPEPDLDNPLDFSALMEGRVAGPENWPTPYTLSNNSGQFKEVETNHFVRMQS